jgi:hypothetical protein
MSSAAYIPLLAFSWGLAGGFSHCIGMCGVFVAAYTAPTTKPKSASPISGDRSASGNTTAIADTPPKRTKATEPQRHFLFHFGRLFTLTLLGAIAGALGDIGHVWAQAQGVISLIAGVAMVGLALGFAGILPWFRIPEPDVLGAGGGALRRLFLRTLQSQNVLRPLMIGAFVGLLPCGLTYQALIPAATSGSILRAMSIMALFCTGTIPGLLTLGIFGNVLFGGILMRPQFRNAMTKVAAVIMGVMGVMFIMRGIGGF